MRRPPSPASGTAASSGNDGSIGAGSEDSGPTTCPAPRTNPGPTAYPAAHTAAFGASARHSSRTANRPDQPSVSCRKEACVAAPCATSDTPSSTAPPPTSTEIPAPAARAATESRARASAPRTSRRIAGGSSTSTPSTASEGRPYAVHTPTPAAPMTRTGRHTQVDTQEGRSAPPDAYSAAAAATGRYPSTTPAHAVRPETAGDSSSSEAASRAARCTSHNGSASSSNGVTPTGAGTPESVSVRTSSTPCASSHSAAATCSAPPGPLSGYGELIHSMITSTANEPSPSPAATAPPRRPAAKPGVRSRKRTSRGGNDVRRAVICITTAMLPTTRAFPS